MLLPYDSPDIHYTDMSQNVHKYNTDFDLDLIEFIFVSDIWYTCKTTDCA